MQLIRQAEELGTNLASLTAADNHESFLPNQNKIYRITQKCRGFRTNEGELRGQGPPYKVAKKVFVGKFFNIFRVCRIIEEYFRVLQPLHSYATVIPR